MTVTIDTDDHPIFHQDRLRLRTPPMAELFETLREWLWTGTTGGLISGSARVGKTTALRAITAELYTRDRRRIPTYYVSMPTRDQRTVVSVFRQLCWSVNLRLPSRERADHLSDLFVHHMADRAAMQHCRYALLVVDEMQRLTPLQFGPFAEIYDKLQMLDIALTVVFVGNDQESTDLLQAIQEPRNAHIRGRFFRQRVFFPGLNSKRDVEACLRQYDELRFPANGPTYTGYFLPQEVDKGFALASLAGVIWARFREQQKLYEVDSWAMQYFIATVNTLLTDFLADPEVGLEAFDEAMVDECIRVSGLLPSLVGAPP